MPRKAMQVLAEPSKASPNVGHLCMMQSLVVGTLQLPGSQPDHPPGQSRVAFPIPVTADQIGLVTWVEHGVSPDRLFPFQR